MDAFARYRGVTHRPGLQGAKSRFESQENQLSHSAWSPVTHDAQGFVLSHSSQRNIQYKHMRLRDRAIEHNSGFLTNQDTMNSHVL